MASVVLAASNQASLTSSVWSGWTGAPHDLLLVAEVNMEKKLHIVNYPRMELSKPTVVCSSQCLAILQICLRLYHILVGSLRYKCGWSWLQSLHQLFFQVVLAGTKTKTVAAVKDLIYTGTCYLDEVIQSKSDCITYLTSDF